MQGLHGVDLSVRTSLEPRALQGHCDVERHQLPDQCAGSVSRVICVSVSRAGGQHEGGLWETEQDPGWAEGRAACAKLRNLGFILGNACS